LSDIVGRTTRRSLLEISPSIETATG